MEGLIALIHETANGLARDGTSRGDLKILLRTLRELRYAFKVFAPFRRQRKVTVFGSARTPSDHAVYRQAVEFGRVLAAHGWLVVTGAASGIMEAAHVGAGREKAMGLNILLPFEQSANPVIAGDAKLVHMKYFFTRKLMFVKESDAFCMLPGGFGTLDEGLEVLTLLQTGKHNMMPVVFLDEPGGDYWKTFDEFVRSRLLGAGLISPEDLSLYCLADDCAAAAAEVTGFYRVYHSMRYVRERLVLRLEHAPSAAELEALNEQFADIVAGGRIELRAALPEERDDAPLAEKPRLVFQFDRHGFGRLRQMIDRINRWQNPASAAPGA